MKIDAVVGRLVDLGPPGDVTLLESAEVVGLLDLAIREKLKIDKNEKGGLRAQNLKANRPSLKRCLHSAIRKVPMISDQWTDQRGPCDECNARGRQCVVVYDMKHVIIKGVGTNETAASEKLGVTEDTDVQMESDQTAEEAPVLRLEEGMSDDDDGSFAGWE